MIMGGGHSENTMLGCALAHQKGGGGLRNGHSQNKKGGGGLWNGYMLGPHLKRHMLGPHLKRHMLGRHLKRHMLGPHIKLHMLGPHPPPFPPLEMGS